MIQGKLLGYEGASWDMDKNERYGTVEELEEFLLYKRIVEWTEDYLKLEDGTIITIEMSDSDCCAYAGGKFKNVELDAMITDVNIGQQVDIPDDDTIVRENTVTIFHNQNPIAQAETYADAGNGGYYCSVGSLVINKIHFPVVDA